MIDMPLDSSMCGNKCKGVLLGVLLGVWEKGAVYMGTENIPLTRRVCDKWAFSRGIVNLLRVCFRLLDNFHKMTIDSIVGIITFQVFCKPFTIIFKCKQPGANLLPL